MSVARGAFALVLVAAAAQAAEPEAVTLDAFSIWTASGAVLETGPGVHTFAGEMRGPYFVDVGKGPIPAGEIACIGALEADETSGLQVGSANCRLVASDGAVAYGAFDCTGYRLIGCTGRFLLQGGEGRMAGASGEGEIVIRRYDTALSLSGDGSVSELALGIASWKGFTLHAAPAASE